MILWRPCAAMGSKIILINGVIALDSWGGRAAILSFYTPL